MGRSSMEGLEFQLRRVVFVELGSYGYPIQPPSVTFATPIYHPNIDTGGRICLDILNLPPKGAWQPSLNISTVLTSIGLLLSEPNPDDGLMCEASREYKYNRQAFDQKARSMTEKYAKAGASENIGGCSQGVLSSSRPSMMESEGLDEEPKREVIDHTIIQKKPCGISRKLSLEFSSSTQKKDCDGEVNGVPSHLVRLSNFENHIEIEEQNKETDGKSGEYNSTCAKLPGTRRKLSLESLGQSQKRDADYQENVLPNTHSSNLKPQSQACSESCSVMQASNHLKHPHQDQDGKSIKNSLSVSSKKPCQVFQRPSSEFSDMPQVVNHNELKPLAEAEPIASRSRHGFGDTKCGKLSLVGKKLSLGFKRSSQIGENDNKENVDPNPNLPLQQDGGAYALRAGDSGMSASNKKRGTGHNDRKLSMNHYTTPSKSLPMPHDISCDWKPQSNQDRDEEIAGGIMEKETEKTPIADALIVLDSEDSEEERNDECLRPKLSLTRRRLAGKWRS